MNGILNVHKPAGMTSHDVVNVIRRLTGIRRCGHTGTLDPEATGVLPVCVGQATRVSEYVLQMDKTYIAAVQLGIATDTEDAQGKAIDQKPVPLLTEKQIGDTLALFLGVSYQIPPMYSAVRLGGKKLYEFARQGQVIERSPRKIEIYSLKHSALLSDRLIFEVKCSRGTYVRTLCRELAEKLGTTGHMASLARSAVGPFLLENAKSPAELQIIAEAGRLMDVILPIDTALGHLPAVTLPEDEVKRLMNGSGIMTGHAFSEPTPVRVYKTDGILVAVGEADKQYIRPKKVFNW